MQRRDVMFGRSIGSRFHLIALFVCAGFSVTVILAILAFTHIQRLTQSVIDKDLAGMAVNARVSRDLSTVIVSAGQLLQAFYGNEAYLEANGRPLLDKSRSLRDAAPTPELRKALRALSSALELLIGQCEQINGQRRTTNQDLAAAQDAFNRMEQAFHHTIAARTALGLEAVIWKERLGALARLRARLVEADAAQTNFWLRLLLAGEGAPIAAGPPELSSLDNVIAAVRNLSAKDPGLEEAGEHLAGILTRYVGDAGALHLLMLGLLTRKADMAVEIAKVSGMMDDMIRQTANAASRVNVSIAQIIRSTAGMLIASSAVIILALWGGLLFLFRRIIVSPMRATLDGIESLRKGDLSATVSLNRKDEWSRIERALNGMARELSASYAALRLSEKNYRDIFENASEGIFQATPKGRLHTANPALARILRYDSPARLLEAAHDIAARLFRDASDWELLSRELSEHGETRGFEARMTRNNGDFIWVSINAHVIADASGGALFYEGSVTDVTARKKAERKLDILNRHLRTAVKDRTLKLTRKAAELERANRRLRELDAMKSAFVSSVSHELRTPLTSILGFAKLIRRDFQHVFAPMAADDERASRQAERIGRNLEIIASEGERLTRLINDLLDLNKIESGRMQWRDVEISPRDVIEKAAEAARGQFESNPKLFLTLDAPQELPSICVDPDRLSQVLINLLNNAVKFTPKGEIRVTALALPQGVLQVRVRDQGVGVKEKDRERIFHKFQQAECEALDEDKPAGTGLGLTICRQIISRYGGRIWVEPAPDRGSEFIFELPFAASEAPARPCAVRVDGKDVPAPLILAVDDDPAFSSYLEEVFANRGYRTITARTGEAALEKAEDYRPSLITMDALMPGMSGQETINRLRAHPEASGIPILVITQLAAARIAGADACLRKPVSERRLMETVELLLAPSDRRGGIAETDAEEIPPPAALGKAQGAAPREPDGPVVTLDAEKGIN